MNFHPVFPHQKRPILIAGPCSAETEEQVLTTAHSLANQGVSLFRAGIWKPRTRPGAFEGIGLPGLKWLQKVKAETGLRVTTEAASTEHVEACLAHEIDVIWIGARTTANPFLMQDLADALAGTNVPVLVKNPVNPDFKLWVGAIERLQQAGVQRLAAVHRGFSSYADSKYRNAPRWQMAIDLMEEFPGMEVICDISHICGRRDILAETAQKAFDLNYDGLMVEVHPTPDAAWSDAAQQITPERFGEMIRALVLRPLDIDDPEYHAQMEQFRAQIDEVDEELIYWLARRMQLVRKIGWLKKDKNVAVLQPERWRALSDALRRRGQKHEFSPEFIALLLEAIHQESINQQEVILNENLAAVEPDGWRAVGM